MAASTLIDLSFAAIQHGALMPVTDIRLLARSLYHYNTAPIPPAKCSLQWDHTTLFTGDSYQDTLAVLKESWIATPDDQPAKYWLSWSSKNPGTEFIKHGDCTYKLYVSPAVADFLPVLSHTILAVSEGKAFSFKTGNNYHGISRPDKIVVYFRHFSDLEDTATKIYTSTASFMAQGVPFTAPLFKSCMLSWGIDPPAGNDEPVSWRIWISNQLAQAIADSKKRLAADTGLAVLDLLRAKGLDTNTWVPNEQLFSNTLS